MRILGIETSCDETSAAVVQNGTEVLSLVIESSVAEHAKTGGVVPEVAARDAAHKIMPAIEKALADAQVDLDAIDAIAVTAGPGLMGSLLVGVETARALAYLRQKPLIPVHHTMGHLSANLLGRAKPPQFPVLVLTVSGGHNDLILWHDYTQVQRLGQTIDDAAGEAFDKGARILGLGFPGGPAIAREAEKGNPNRFDFPRPMRHSKDLNFSFSGLKTALLYAVRDLGGIENIPQKTLADLSAGYQEAITDSLAAKLFAAIDIYPEIREIHLTGGVSANRRLREKCALQAQKRGLPFRFPEKIIYCTDNAAMIAVAGFYKFKAHPGQKWDWREVQATVKREWF